MFPKPYDLNNKTVKNYLIKIGEIIVIMGFLEAWIDFWIWELIGAKGGAYDSQIIGKKTTSGMMYRRKVDLLLLLVQSRYPTKVDSFKKLHNKLQTLGDKRNNFIHSQWFPMYGNKEEHIRRDTHIENLRYGVNKKDGSVDFSKSYSKLKLNDLTRLINNIRFVYNDVTKFFIT